jgi:uncharacterized oligopeptide transporter (OPT) family protein
MISRSGRSLLVCSLGESTSASHDRWSSDRTRPVWFRILADSRRVVLCMTNVYFGLQTGWVSMMSLQSALLGFAIFKAIPRVLPRLKIKPFTPQENVILQTVAVATGTMPLAAGLVGIIPALEMMSETMDGRGPVVLGAAGLIMWCMAVAFFGYVETQVTRRHGTR